MMKQFVLVCLSLFTSFACLCQAIADVPSRYLRNNNKDTVIVFVHGVLSGADTAWQAPTTSFPELVAKDSTFDDSDIFILSYPTSLWATMSVDELADSIGTTLKADGVLDHTNLIFVAHSMGGLVTKKFLLKTRDTAARTKFIYFYSTTMQGSSLTNLASIISNNPQFSSMQPTL
jgi:triacylglycerol esterase/lipase EstA (alpha/beta hydrolase family)